MNRRQALRRFAVAGSASLAGCSSVLGPGGTVLGRIRVVNTATVANRIRLLVTRGEETLVDQTFSLAAMDAADGDPSRVVEPTWAAQRGRYTVDAIHYGADGERETSGRAYTFTGADYDAQYGDTNEDPGCVAAVVVIGGGDEENAEIGIGPIHAANPCGASDSE